jgi:hypothetical protein
MIINIKRVNELIISQGGRDVWYASGPKEKVARENSYP